MAKNSWTVIDVEKGIYLDEFSKTPQDVLGSASGYSVIKRTLRGGLQDGVDIVELDNGTCRFTLIPTRGMGIWKAWVGETQIGWNSPILGPVHPRNVPLMEPSGLGWLDGFDELLVRCGLESNGAPEYDEQGRVTYPLHGRVANRPAHQLVVSVDGDSGEISVTGVVDESRFHFQKLRLISTVSIRPGEKGLRIHDRVVNLSGVSAGLQMLYHINFGDPLLDPGAQVVAPVKNVVPRNADASAGVETWHSFEAEKPGFAEQVYFFDLQSDSHGHTRTMLKNAHSTQGVSILFNNKQLPCFTLWKNTVSRADGYVTGLEPGTNFPNPRSYETSQGRVVQLPPAKQVDFELALEFHTNADEVAAAEKTVQQLKGDREPQLFDQPQPGWTPG